MNKCVSLVIAVLFLVLLLSGCNQVRQQDNQEHMGSAADPISEYDKETSSSGFLIKEKKYTYQGNNVMILRLENQTNLDYSIILTGEFYDAAGQKIKTESKSFEGFAAGYQNYFVFQPGICFESFNCTLELVDFQGIAFAQYIQTFSSVKLHINRQIHLTPGTLQDSEFYVGIFGDFYAASTYPEILNFAATFVLFDCVGDIYVIDDHLQQTTRGPITNGNESNAKITRVIQDTNIRWNDRAEFIWPDKLTNNSSGLVAVRSVSLP